MKHFYWNHSRNSTKWTKGQFSNYGVYWITNDVIGLLIDIDNKIIKYYLNGKDLGIAFDNFNIGDGIAPSLSIDRGGEFIIVTDYSKYKYNIPHCYNSIQCVNSNVYE